MQSGDTPIWAGNIHGREERAQQKSLETAPGMLNRVDLQGGGTK